MTGEVVGTAVGTFVTLEKSYHPYYPHPYMIVTVLVLPVTLLCLSYLSQCLYYRSCHTWSIINKPYYPCSSCHYSSICGSHREEIVEEIDPEQEADRRENTNHVHPNTLPTRCRETCKMKLCCFPGCSNESVIEEISMGHINNVGQGRSKSLSQYTGTP